MNARIFAGVAGAAVSIILSTALASSQPEAPADGTQSPGWFLQRSTAESGGPAATADASTSACSHSPVCDNRVGGSRQALQLVEWKQTMGYTYAYPFHLPAGGHGAVEVAINSKGAFWVLQRNGVGKPQLFEFSPNYELIRSIGDEVIGHQEKAHSIKVDPEDNLWICDTVGAAVTKLSPEGKLLMTLGLKGQRGDWDEAKRQRLLWEPTDLAFAPNSDIYIGEGHANESPNDTGSSSTNNVGAARVLHLDKNGKFINQWYGNSVGQGKFSMAHGIAVDPKTGNVWIGDREEYRLVVYTGNGTFVKTIQMRNLTSAIAFDPVGDLWVATGQDGQLIKIDRNGKVLGAVGNGPGKGHGQFIGSSYMVWDKDGNIYTGETGGETSVGRITEMVAPKK